MDELSYLRELRDLRRKLYQVRMAWRDPGIHPPTHHQAKAKLLREWPVLARALEEL